MSQCAPTHTDARVRSCHELGVCQSRPDCQAKCSHDTSALTRGDFYFAPGAIEHPPRRTRRISPLGRLVLQGAAVLATAAALGALAGYMQAGGWPL